MDNNEFINKIKSFFTSENLEKIFSKQGFEKFFGPILSFIKKHKVVSSIAAVVILLMVSVLMIGNHYLNKINYDDGSNPSVVYTQVAVVTLGTGETIDLENAEFLKDGTYKLSDGRIYKPDGSVVNVDGSIIFKDGSYITAGGIAVLSDGTTIYQDGLIVFQDGSYISGSGIIVGADGVATFNNGSMAHISTFNIDKNGRINIKPEYLGSTTTQNGTTAGTSGTTNGTTNIFGQPTSGKDQPIGTTIGGVYTTTTVVTQGVDKVVLPSAVGTTADKNTTDKYEAVFGTTAPTKKPSSGKDNGGTKVTTPSTTNLVDLEDSDQVISSVKQESSEIKDKLEENDELIEQNLNDNEIWYHDDIKNILLMGIDQGSRSFPYGRSDAMILVSINKKTKKVKLVSLSRTAYVAIDGYENTRLNHAHGYGGPRLAIKTIENNYKIRIDNYVSTTFSAFQSLIDAIGGVNITFTSAEASALKNQIRAAGLTYAGAGTYKLNGRLALEYVRLRKIDTDRERTGRQRKVLTAIANSAKSMSIWQLNDMLNKVLPYITTDLSKSEIVGQLTNVPSYLSNSFEQYVLPHKSSALTLIGDFEVVTVDWKDETAYTHKLIYGGLTPKYYKR